MVAWAVALWREPVHERRMACVELLTLAAPRLPAADLAVVERLLRESDTWALVDGLAASVAGEIRKAIGWVLREISRRDPSWVAAFTERHISEMSGVTFRDAVRRLPPEDATRLTQVR